MSSGLRELKKQRTRFALIDAALELFLRHGYEQTTIDEIVSAVEVSQRTFFRYFATKEELLLDLMGEWDRIMLAEVAARPAGEPPTETLVHAIEQVLRDLDSGDAAELERLKRIRQVIETTPALIAAQLASMSRAQQALTVQIALRMGLEPDDLRPKLLVSMYFAAVRVGFEDCAHRNMFDMSAITARVSESVALAMGALREDWDRSAG